MSADLRNTLPMLQKGLIIACNDNELPVAAYLMRRVDEQCPYVKLYIFVDNRDESSILPYQNDNRAATGLEYSASPGAYSRPSSHTGIRRHMHCPRKS